MAYPPMPAINIDRMAKSEAAAIRRRRRNDLRDRVAAQLFVGELAKLADSDMDTEETLARWAASAAAVLVDAVYPPPGD